MESIEFLRIGRLGARMQGGDVCGWMDAACVAQLKVDMAFALLGGRNASARLPPDAVRKSASRKCWRAQGARAPPDAARTFSAPRKCWRMQGALLRMPSGLPAIESGFGFPRLVIWVQAENTSECSVT